MSVELYPPAPANVPPDLIAPSRAYRLNAWLAMAVLVTFVAVYFGLMGYFGWLIYRLFLARPSWPGFFTSLPAALFFALMARGLFFRRRGGQPKVVELLPAEHPKLFAFLYRLADEAGAPRPHRVFASAGVNASVFYDLSLLNLLFPTRKNLDIGLGLVNALTLDEMKAVIAHEYGHFAQRTMAVGRWVYIAEQIAGQIVMGRGAIDRFLNGLSYSDLRIAWIGWILRLFVWAIRAVLDTFFRLVVLANLALMREMEFNADLVSVSVSGSDSLIHALARLGAADEAWQEALDTALQEESKGRPVADLFALQTAALEHLRRILARPAYGDIPRSATTGTASHRVFAERLAAPPRMWSTHPANRDREDNAKRLYTPSNLDPRSAWALFDDPDGLRARMTRALLAGVVPSGDAPPPPPVPVEDSLERLDRRFGRPCLATRYRGIYMGRATAAHARRAEDLYERPPLPPREAVLAAIDACYPESLRETLTRYRELDDEERQLEGLEQGFLTAPGGILRHRGREIRRKDLPEIRKEVGRARKALEDGLVRADVAHRTAHLCAARTLERGWDTYLTSLIALLHYTTHASHEIRDAHGYLVHVFQVVTADQRVSDSERRWLVNAGSELHARIAAAYADHGSLEIPADVRQRFDELGGFQALQQKLGLHAPDEATIGDFLQYVDEWSLSVAADLSILSDVTLDALLDAEDHVAKHLRDGSPPGDAPRPARVPSQYAIRLAGDERPRQKKLDLWDRFVTADGVFPGLARLVVASAVLVPALTLGGRIGDVTVHAHNGLGVPVVVYVGAGDTAEGHTIDPHGTAQWSIEPGAATTIVTRAPDRTLIERFEVKPEEGFGDYVYNVARASAFVRWTAVYHAQGSSLTDGRPTLSPAGAARFFRADEDVILEEPPRSVSSRSGSGASRSVLTAVEAPEVSTAAALYYASSDADRDALVLAHLRFDPPRSPEFSAWALARRLSPADRATLRERAGRTPDDDDLQRTLWDVAERDERARLCDTYRAARTPTLGLRYLRARCLRDRTARGEALLALRAEARDHGHIAWSAARELARRGRWSDALEAYHTARARLPAPRGLIVELEGTRLRRYAEFVGGIRPEEVSPFPVSESNTVLRLLQGIDAPATPDESPEVRALRALARDDLDAAANLLRAAGSDNASLSALIALRPNAPRDFVTRALSLPPGELNGALLPSLLVLLLREHGDPAPTVAALREAYDDDADALIAALGAPDLAAHPERLESIARAQYLVERGAVFAAGVVRLGDAAPARWRDEARALLYVSERPF